ncbi:hypothetical protein [Micromonospora sp. NPDC023888]
MADVRPDLRTGLAATYAAPLIHAERPPPSRDGGGHPDGQQS